MLRKLIVTVYRTLGALEHTAGPAIIKGKCTESQVMHVS